MHPVILRIGPLNIYSYGLMLALAFLAAIVFALPQSKRCGISSQTIFDVALISVFGGLIGARLWYVAFEWKQYFSNPIEIFQIQKGGLAVQGGLALAIAVNYLYCKIKRLNFWQLADILAPSVILGQAIGRIGCFLNGCCYGTPTRSILGVVFPPDSPAALKFGAAAVHPTEIYQMLANLLVFGILLSLRNRVRMANGSIFLLYIALYSVGRFVVEMFRGDKYLVAWGLSNAQLASVVSLVVAIVFLLWRNRITRHSAG